MVTRTNNATGMNKVSQSCTQRGGICPEWLANHANDASSQITSAMSAEYPKTFQTGVFLFGAGISVVRRVFTDTKVASTDSCSGWLWWRTVANQCENLGRYSVVCLLKSSLPILKVTLRSDTML